MRIQRPGGRRVGEDWPETSVQLRPKMETPSHAPSVAPGGIPEPRLPPGDPYWPSQLRGTPSYPAWSLRDKLTLRCAAVLLHKRGKIVPKRDRGCKIRECGKDKSGCSLFPTVPPSPRAGLSEPRPPKTQAWETETPEKEGAPRGKVQGKLPFPPEGGAWYVRYRK